MVKSPAKKHTVATRFYRIGEMLQFIIPLSMRGVLLGLTIAYLVLSPILKHSDIVASIICAVLASVIIAIIGCAVIAGTRIRRHAKPRVIIPTSSLKPNGQIDDALYAGSSAAFLVTFDQITIPPLFRLKLTLQFKQSGIAESCHLLSGVIDQRQPIVVPVSFPHRGIWRIAGISLALEDIFGISYQLWSDRSNATLAVAVHPAAVPHSRIPVISSSYRAGDDINHHTQRLGELFDLKPYHPSDGIKRILWKVFAKSGELVARHPEQAVTPEGHVIAYVLAHREDDRLAAWTLNYLHELEDLNLTMEVGCLGMRIDAPFARSTSEAEQLLIECAFSAPEKITGRTGAQIATIISARNNSGEMARADAIALFVSETIFHSKKDVIDILALVDELSQAGITPTICLHSSANYDNDTTRMPSKLTRLFLQPRDAQKSSFEENPEARSLFINSCALKNIIIHRDKGFFQGVRSE